jgi:hypothetical protein
MSLFSRSVGAAAIVALMTASYFAGAAQSADTAAVTKLNSTIDFLTKAQALLNAVSTRQSYANVEKAKASVKEAIAETQKAVVANGG